MQLGGPAPPILELNGHNDSTPQAYAGGSYGPPHLKGTSHYQSGCFTSYSPSKVRERVTALSMLDACHPQPIRPSHHCPVILIGRSTRQASLVVTAVFADARPREPVRTTTSEKPLQEFQWVTPWFRLFQ